MRTRSQKANSGSPLQSLSAVDKPRRTRAKKDAAGKEPAAKAPAKPATRTRKATSTTKTTTTTTTTASAKNLSPPATINEATTTKSDAAVTLATETAMQTPTTTRRKRVLRRREPLTPRAAPQAQVPQLSGEELLQMVVDAREERRKHARNVLPDRNDDDNNTSPHKQPTTPQQAQQTDVAPQATPQRSVHKPSPQQPTPQQPTTPAHQTSPAHQASPATPATASAPANPTTPDTRVAASQPDTPRTTGWGIRSLFSSFLPSVFSPGRSAAATPATGAQTQTQTKTQTSPTPGSATATSATQNQAGAFAENQPATPAQQDQILLNQDQVDEIGAGLAPTLTPTRASTRRTTRTQGASKSRRNSSSKSSSGENAIIKTAIRDVNAEQRALATAWAQQTAQKITADTTTLGSKRRQLEQPMKLRDVKDIPARRPWEPTGSFGLLPEFFDDSDSDEEAPGWYLVDQLANEQPALKKRKLSNGPDKTPVANESRHRLFDTGGNSASLYDLHPRPCTVPSPMFDNPVTHHQGANVFAEHRTQTAPDATPPAETPARDREAFLKELRRTGHVPGSGSFCVPESDSDESDDEDLEDQENVQQDNPSSLPWTQSPPPAPTPAHAKLPAQPDAVSFSPETQREPRSVDPVQTQRAKALKHTPAKQSRLREVMLPSPSLKSDSGSSPLVATASPTPFAPAAASPVHIVSEDDDIPDAIPLDFGDQALMDAALALARGASNDKAYGGSEVLYKYDEDDEIISEEDDEDLF